MTDSLSGPVVIYDIVYKPDGTADVNLSHIHRQVLLYIASRAGEIDYDFALLKRDEDPEWEAHNVRRFGEPLADHVKRIIKMGLVKASPIIGAHADKVRLRLTDMGRNIATKILADQGTVL